MIKKLLRRLLVKLGIDTCYYCGRRGFRLKTYPIGEDGRIDDRAGASPRIYAPMCDGCIYHFEEKTW